jgi:lipoprotein-anchoring transpeptidase ErfK/SrfK
MNKISSYLRVVSFLMIYLAATILVGLFSFKFTFSNILPKYFSNQGTINPNTLEEDLSDENYGIYNNNTIEIAAMPKTENPKVLGDKDDNSDENKRIEVDLTNQKLYAYEGKDLIYEFTVSTGKWGKTPTGEFRIWTKLLSTRMNGGSKKLGTYYDLPKVPHTMFFSNDKIPASRGFGIHGAYWHNNFGQPMSHGCVNMKLDDAEKLYYWADPELKEKTSIKATKENPGTKIIIYGKAPNY